MRGFYELSRQTIQSVLVTLCGLGNVSVEDRDTVLAALNAYRQGLDFADALHLARSKACAAFLSFDRRLHKRAMVAGLLPKVENPAR
jgi:predicted nucleic-acid-binding protein